MNDLRESITVVIPCYNSETSILRSVQSVLTQSVNVLEVIVVDDASNDRSREVLGSYFSSYDGPVLCRLVEQPINLGASAARNRGIQESSGVFIALLDSDDFWLPNHIETNLKIMQQLDTNSFAIVHEPHTHESLKTEKQPSDDLPTFREFSVLYYLLIQKNCSTITLFAPAELVKSCPFPEGQSHAEDFSFFITLFRKVDSRVFVVHPRTAVMGKHAWASDKGLSSNRKKMLIGSLRTIVLELWKTPFVLLLPFLLIWHLAKALRREVILFSKKKSNQIGVGL